MTAQLIDGNALSRQLRTEVAHRANIMEKLGANTVADLLKIALGQAAAKA